MPIGRSLEIRRGIDADAGALADLRYTWRADERNERGLDRPTFTAAFQCWMHEHRSSHVPFLAIADGTPVGMAWLAIVERIPGPELWLRRSAYIQSTYVVASERGGGIGTALLTCLLAHARELGLDYLAVHPSERAYPLYRRLGFEGSDRVLELRD